jgi:hypothetical protein
MQRQLHGHRQQTFQQVTGMRWHMAMVDGPPLLKAELIV